MLRLFVHIKDQRLKVREASPLEPFENPCRWDDLEFVYSDSADFMMLWSSLLPDISPDKARALIRFQGDRYPVSPNYQKLKSLCPEVVYPDDQEEWVFFGGTFNPWHEGHQAAIKALPPEKHCFVLPDINPLKPLRDFDLTVSVLEISTRIRLARNQFLVPTFLAQNVKNPTVEWIERLHQEYPDKKLSLLLGFDSFASLPKWTRPEDLLKNLHCLYVISRLETDHMREEVLKTIQGPQVIFLGRHEFETVSSTEIRSRK